MKRILLCGVALGALAVVPAMADGPAVSDINGKVSAGGGTFSNSSLYFGTGSIDIPLGDEFGAQVDGVVGKIHDFTFYGGGGHLFWRDPDSALLGVYGSITHVDLPLIFSADISHLAGEIEWYASDKVTLSAVAGAERLALNPIGHTTRWYDRADFTYYPTDNFSIGVGHRYTLTNHAGVVNAAYQFEGTNFQIFAQGRLGEGGSNSGLFGGITYAFGGDKTLKERSREDDPADGLVDDMGGGGDILGAFGGEGSD